MTTPKPYFSIDWLKSNCKMIHYFGLGFIQIKLDSYERMHVYTTLLPPIIGDEDVHNHRYNFKSRILKGTFSQDLFKIDPSSDTHVLEQESCKEGVQFADEGLICGVELVSNHKYVAGSEYYINHKTFHRVSADECITLVIRDDYSKDLAEVVRPVGATKVCPFSQKIDEKELWEMVWDALRLQ